MLLLCLCFKYICINMFVYVYQKAEKNLCLHYVPTWKWTPKCRALLNWIGGAGLCIGRALPSMFTHRVIRKDYPIPSFMPKLWSAGGGRGGLCIGRKKTAKDGLSRRRAEGEGGGGFSPGPSKCRSLRPLTTLPLPPPPPHLPRLCWFGDRTFSIYNKQQKADLYQLSRKGLSR